MLPKKLQMKKPAYKTILAILSIIWFLPVFCVEETLPPVEDMESNTKYVVVIDAGHGGGDWGVTVRGTHEKTITLEISKLIKEKIEATEKDIIVYLTREEDEFLKIEDRAGISNSRNASAFISIHCDYMDAQGIEGYKIYYALGEPLYKQEAEEGEEIDIVKWKDVQRYHVDESMKLAGYISQYMQAALISEESSITGSEENDLLPFVTRREKGVRSNILMGVNSPAIQVEIGNMKNKGDLMYLKDNGIINQVAYHIKEGIIHYFNDQNMPNEETQQGDTE